MWDEHFRQGIERLYLWDFPELNLEDVNACLAFAADRER
jgi:uncharacterized protein (DUF433 family)